MSIARHSGVLAFAAVVAALPGPATASISEAELHAQIETFVRSVGDATDSGLDQIAVPSLRDFTQASTSFDPVEVRLTSRASGPKGDSMPVTVSLVSQGREFKRGVVTVQLGANRSALVTTRIIDRGEVIGAGDVRIEPRPSSQLVRGSVQDPSRVVGRRAKRSLRRGTPLRHDLIEQVPTVVRGETVRIRLSRGSLRIDAVGRAREDGVPGKPVRVLNTQTRREIVGIVGEDGLVHVGF
jgi:flagella basal body P-ring formation protein FlgA